MSETVTFLEHPKDWTRGFEVGIAYVLMSQHSPRILGIYDERNSEQLFLFAHQMGYKFDWKTLKDGMAAVEFIYQGSDEDNNDDYRFLEAPQ